MKNKYKTGAASFYIVAFSTLILVIIAASFATAIVAEITRSSNDDLSQSAYDAALAGVEDAKLAFNNYYNCIKDGAVYDKTTLSNGEEVTCQDIVYWMEHTDINEGGCDMVGHILGRIEKSVSDSKTGVPVEEGKNNNMEQAYTCTIINTKLTDYRATLSQSENYRVVSPEFDNGKHAKDVAYMKINWYLNNESVVYNYKNSAGGKVSFPSLNSDVPVPPVIAMQLIQTADNFSLQQLIGKNVNETTDRAAVYLVPTDNQSMAETKTGKETYEGIYGKYTVFGKETSMNLLSASQIAKTNDHSKDLPYVVLCDKNDEYACSTMIKLPEPINGERSDGTFTVIVSLPYGQPETDFSLEFYDKNGNALTLGRTQIAIDSTGRANDLYRRVEVRLEPAGNSFDYPFYAVQLGDGDNGEALSKELKPTTEWSASEYPGYNNY